MPEQEVEQRCFINYATRAFVPRGVNFDRDLLFVPVAGPKPNLSDCFTQMEQHQPCGYELAVIDHGKSSDMS